MICRKRLTPGLAPLPGWKPQSLRFSESKKSGNAPLTVRVDVRYDLVARRHDEKREERVGSRRMVWSRDATQAWKTLQWEAGEETVSVMHGPAFIDVTAQAIGETASYTKQLAHGADYWRTVLDGAVGVDVYGNNGVAAGDFDNDGFEISMFASLPDCPIAYTGIAAMARSKTSPKSQG